MFCKFIFILIILNTAFFIASLCLLIKIHLDLEKSFSLTGLRGNIWSDKCINFVVYQNARVGLHVDQSAVDANVLCSFLERLRVAE